MMPQTNDRTMLSLYHHLTAAQHDHLLIAWAAQAGPGLTYVPMTTEQARLAQELREIELLTYDNHLTAIGEAIIEYDLALLHSYFIGDDCQDDDNTDMVAM